MSQAMSVGDWIASTLDGRSPRQPGPTIANAPLPLPVVRVPGEAITLVQASSSCIV